MIIQGREIIPKDIEFIREMIKAHPSWGCTKLSKELAVLWNWRAANGHPYGQGQGCLAAGHILPFRCLISKLI